MKHNLNKKARKIRKKLKSLDVKEIEKLINTYGYAVAYIGTKQGDEELLKHSLEAYACEKKSFLYSRTVKIVFIRYDLHNRDKVYALLHELAHIELGHIGNGESAFIDSTYAEIEAQALSYLIVEQENYLTFIKWTAMIAIIFCITLATSTGITLSNSAQTKTVNTDNIIPISEQTKPPIQQTEDTAYITSTGECYHKPNCRYVRNNSAIEINYSDAKRLYRPCSICKP